jgi:hypothetical protein
MPEDIPDRMPDRIPEDISKYLRRDDTKGSYITGDAGD